MMEGDYLSISLTDIERIEAEMLEFAEKYLKV